MGMDEVAGDKGRQGWECGGLDQRFGEVSRYMWTFKHKSRPEPVFTMTVVKGGEAKSE